MSLGTSIKKLRIDQGIKQKDLRASLGMTHRHLSDIERDKCDPRISEVVRIADVLHVSLDHLLGRSYGAANLP